MTLETARVHLLKRSVELEIGGVHPEIKEVQHQIGEVQHQISPVSTTYKRKQ